MIRFRTFGTVELEDADGNEVRSVLAQPKRVALLAYLAAASPRGFQRRDTLFALFWPDLDAGRARGALNTAVYNLRRSLGAGAVVNRGDEEIGLDPERIRCDAARFEEALEADALPEALDLYRGEFLTGFHLSAVPRWERWLGRERRRLRERARSAAWTLAERAEQAGDVEQATHWARRMLRIAPHDERALRRLVSLLDHGGDRASALAAYDEFAESLAKEYDSLPAPETRALVDAIRERESTRAAASVGSGSAAAATRYEAEADTNVDSGGEARGTRRDRLRPRRNRSGKGRDRSRGQRTPRLVRRTVARRWLAPVALAAVLGGAAILARLGGPDLGAEGPDGRLLPADAGSPTTVAVLPFAIHGDERYAHLEEGMVDLLSVRLSGIHGLRAVDPRALLAFLDRTGRAGAADDLERGRAAARYFGARYVVLGSVVETGAEVQFTASAFTAEADEPVARAVAAGGGDHLPALIDEVARRLLLELPGPHTDALAAGGGGDGRGGGDSAGGTLTSSLTALDAYLAGRRALRAGRYDAAAEAFRRAVREDTTFALAYYGWSNAAIWNGRSDVAAQARDAAFRHGAALSERQRLLLRAWERHWAGAPAEAEHLYRRVLERRPDDVEAWYQLGDLLFHWGPYIGRPRTAAREAFERVRYFEPDNAGALIHLARIAGAEARPAELDSLLNRAIELNPSDAQRLELNALRAYGSGNADDRAAVHRDAAFADNTRLRGLVASIAAHTGDLEGAAELARGLIVPERQESWHVFHLQAAVLEAARGRWNAAQRELAALGTRHPARAAEFRAMLATLPFVSLPAAQLRVIRDALPPVDTSMAVGSWIDFLPANGIYAPRALYLLGLIELRLGDASTATRHVTTLERFRWGNATDAAFAASFARTLRAEIARRTDGPGHALALLGEPGVPPDSLLPTLVSYPTAHARWLRAELLRESGRGREALDWYATFPSPQAYDIAYVAAAHLRRAEIHERLGERAETRRHFAAALDHWRDAGPIVASMVELARQGLVRIR